MGLLDLTVTGNKAILDNLGALEERVRDSVQAKLEEAGEYALGVARELVPVDTGALRDSLYIESQPGIVTVGADQPYAVYVELGHHTRSGSWVPAQPYLIPAMAQAGDKLKDSLSGLI